MTKQRKEEKQDPPFQKPKKKGWGTATRKDKFKAASASLGCATRQDEIGNTKLEIRNSVSEIGN
jgi:hypothetical protein